MNITLNGIARQELSGISLAELIASLGQSPQGLATAVNQEFVARDQRTLCILQDGDSVTTFQPITGG
jgi:sulfur carrier protein